MILRAVTSAAVIALTAGLFVMARHGNLPFAGLFVANNSVVHGGRLGQNQNMSSNMGARATLSPVTGVFCNSRMLRAAYACSTSTIASVSDVQGALRANCAADSFVQLALLFSSRNADALCVFAAIPRTSGHQTVSCETTAGKLVFDIYPQWAPLGSARFIELVAAGYFSDVSLYRVVPRFLLQFGITGSKDLNDAWSSKPIKDDPKQGDF